MRAKSGRPTRPTILSLLFGAFLMSGITAKQSEGMPTMGTNGYIGGGSPEYHPRGKKLKGYMRENRRMDRGHGHMKYKFAKH